MRSLVSVIVLNWNGKEHLRNCLLSLSTVSYRPLEIIVVDNHSVDGSQAMVRSDFPNVILIKNKENLGYAAGNNIGITKSKGSYVFILNNDTKVTKTFLNPLVSLMEEDPTVACVQPKLLYGDNHEVLNAVGSYFTSTGFLYHFGYRENQRYALYNKRIPIYSAKGAALLFRRSALLKVGLFDDDFFIFFEETDLCHRLWLAGYTIFYEPTSVVYHYEALDTSKQMRSFTRTYLSFRNRIISYLKNLEAGNAVLIITRLLLIYVGLVLLYFFTFRLTQSGAVIASIVWNIREFPKTMEKRRVIQQKIRKVTDSALFKTISRKPPVFYYWRLFRNSLGTFHT